MLKRKSLIQLFLLSTVILFSGCQAGKEFNSLMGIANTPQELVAKSGDKELSTLFSKYMKTRNPTTGRFSKDSIILREDHFSFDDYVEQSSLQDRVARKYDESQVVEEYKNAILKRGNSFKVYKNALNKEIFRVAHNAKTLKRGDKYSYFRYNWTPTIIEYTNTGKIKSVMTQVQEVWVAYNHFRNPSAPAKAQSTITIFTGYKASSLRNKISNRQFENNFLYGSKANNSVNKNNQYSNNKNLNNMVNDLKLKAKSGYTY